MSSLPEKIMGYAKTCPEATPFSANDRMPLDDRAMAGRSLSCLATARRLLRISRGVYLRSTLRPSASVGGPPFPAPSEPLQGINAHLGETHPSECELAESIQHAT